MNSEPRTLNLVGLLKDYTGLPERELDQYFVITETEAEHVIQPIRHLEIATFKAVARLASDYGGAYDSKPKGSCFRIPKQSAELIPNPVINDHGIHSEPFIDKQKLEVALGHRMPETDEQYTLSRSLKGKLGQLVPCLEDADGRIFDGIHRKEIDPNAWTVKVDKVKTAVDRALARMTVNFCRRHYTSEEMTNDIGVMIGSGMTVDQIAEATGISTRTVYNYMPQTLKNQVKVEARLGKVSDAPVQQTVKIQDSIVQSPTLQKVHEEVWQQIRPCEKCGAQVHRTKMSIVDKLLVCPRCAGKTEAPRPPEKPKQPLFKDKWEHKLGIMKVQHSKLELELLTELSKRNLTPKTDEVICLWGTFPDGKYEENKLAYYVHGEPHDSSHAMERDDEIEAALVKQGWTVLVFRHGEGTVQEWADQVAEALKF